MNDVPPGMIKDLDQGKAYLQIVSGPDDKAVFKGNVRFFSVLTFFTIIFHTWCGGDLFRAYVDLGERFLMTQSPPVLFFKSGDQLARAQLFHSFCQD